MDGKFRLLPEWLFCRLAIGTGAPIDDLCLIDLKTGVTGCVQAGCRTDGAIDIIGFSAGAADQMVMVVPDPIFIKGGRTRGLNAADETLFDQHSKGIVNRLLRNGPNVGADVLGDRVHRAVRPVRDGLQHGQALGRDGDAILAEQVGRFGHRDQI